MNGNVYLSAQNVNYCLVHHRKGRHVSSYLCICKTMNLLLFSLVDVFITSAGYSVPRYLHVAFIKNTIDGYTCTPVWVIACYTWTNSSYVILCKYIMVNTINSGSFPLFFSFHDICQFVSIQKISQVPKTFNWICHSVWYFNKPNACELNDDTI